MDPSRTLVAFLLETDPSVATVQLIGSWDNFASCYPMERDARRGRGHWRGCHSLKDVVCDDGSGSRYKTHTGLAMGHTYYYYYEVDGSTEICDSAMPSTTACPYLPGQKVNTLYIPEERTTRRRRASLSSLSDMHLRTMDPRSKFVTPQPAPASHANLSMRRTGTAAPAVKAFELNLKDHSSSTAAPKTSWKRFFPKTLISRQLGSRGRSVVMGDHRSLVSAISNYDIRPQTASDGTRTRDISPDSLRRFLSDDVGTSARPISRGSLGPSGNPHTLTLDVIDQVDEEEDDDNFVGTNGHTHVSVPDEPAFTTRLSPPPFRRGISSAAGTSSSHTVVPTPSRMQPALQTSELTPALLISPVPQQPAAQLADPESPSFSPTDYPGSVCPSSTLSSAMNSPSSPTPSSFPSFYDEALDEDDDIDDRFPFASRKPDAGATGAAVTRGKHVKAPSVVSFSQYRLPQPTHMTGKMPPAEATLSTSPKFATVSSPLLLARPDDAAVRGNGGPSLLGSSLDMGLDDFVTELSWMADTITNRQ